MPSEYNCTRYTLPTNTVRIAHFAGFKADKWRLEPIVQQYREMGWDRALELHEENVAKHG
jgi:hypothetical protein